MAVSYHQLYCLLEELGGHKGQQQQEESFRTTTTTTTTKPLSPKQVGVG